MWGPDRRFWRVTGGVLVLALAAGSSGARAQLSRSIVIGARVGVATALRVSESVLRVPASIGGQSAVLATIDVEAAARTRTDGEVVLTVEALSGLGTLGAGAPQGEVAIEFAGSADGMESGTLSATPQVAGRWSGSGVRRGRLTFTLHASGDVTGGVVQLRFLLTTP